MDTQPEKPARTHEQPLVRFGLRLANCSERWFPDPLVFALLGIVVVFVVGLLLHQRPAQLAIQGGKSFLVLAVRAIHPLDSAMEIDSSCDRNLTAGIPATILAFLTETIS